MDRKPEFWDRLSPHQKMQYAIRHSKTPIRYEGEDVAAARKQEEVRELIGIHSTPREIKRDRETHETVTEYKGFVSRTQRYIQKRKGILRNHVEEQMLNRVRFTKKSH